MTWGSTRLAAALLAAAAGACTAQDTVATTSDGTGDDLAGYCEEPGPPVLIDGTCSGDLAETLFRHAVCGCGSLAFAADLVADGFDSDMPPYAPGGGGGHVASNVGLDSSRMMTITGDVTVGGPEGVEAGELLRVGGDLSSGGQLGRSSSAIQVVGAARIAGDVNVASMSVGGTLIISPGVSVTGDVMADVRESAEVSVPPPCRCDHAPDIAATVADHAVSNHDAELGLDPAALIDVEGDQELELPCGRFYLDGITGHGEGTLTIRAAGRTALFVGGNITLQQGLTIELAQDAELDLFIDGNIQVAGVTRLGDATRPRSLRLYVARGGSIALAADSSLAGNLYAPLADLASAAPLEVYGALVVNRVNGADTVSVHYDRAVATAGEACDDE